MAKSLPGLALSVGIALVAAALGSRVPLIGAPVFGIVIGMLARALFKPGAAYRSGIAFAGKHVLQIAIVLLGTGLSLGQILTAGTGSLPVMLGTMAAALFGAWFFGRLLRVEGGLTTLIGVGTGICGASAIAAVSSAVESSDLEIAYSITTIFVFNVVAVLFYPTVGRLLGLSQHAFGLWAGTAINDMSSVVAAAYTYGHTAGTLSVIVKLTRTTMIVPITLAVAAARVWRGRAQSAAARGSGPQITAPRIAWRRVIPWFIVWFLAAAVANTLGAFDAAQRQSLSGAALFLITVALAAIGLSAEFGQMRRTGLRPLLLGAALWATVGLSSLLLQALTGTL